ncbi:unnamed protein product [Peniophora sp. CBMAI 1063]|nr:unnamed protein product [Peniophora sp. CBMAI 1063]
MSRRQWTHTPIRELHAPVPPPTHLTPEPPLHLLSPLGSELDIPGYRCSTHVFPAAWPRSTPFVPYPDDLQGLDRIERKEERKARLARVADTMLAIKAAYEREGGDAQNDESGRILWMTATRWVRTTGASAGTGGKTLLCTHANGLHGSTYAPVLRRLLAQRQDIAEVWALDGVQHGDAALLNAGKLGILYDWHEMARDALCFLQHFLPSELDPTPLPTSLPRLSLNTSFRKVYGLGHSFGGCSLVLAAYRNPEHFAALMLADAVIVPADMDRSTRRAPGWVAPDGTKTSGGHNSLPSYVIGALSRRSRWPSRTAAYEALASNPFFGSWDKDVLDIYVKHALVEEKEGGEVRLKCEGVSEAAVFAEARAPREAWSALPKLDGRIPLLWINPPAGESLVQTQEIADARVRLRSPNSAHVTIPNGTHLIVQTHPRQVAEAAHLFLQAVDSGAVGDVHELLLRNSEGTTPAQSGSRARL